jgi:hypothetical protein
MSRDVPTGNLLGLRIWSFGDVFQVDPQTGIWTGHYYAYDPGGGAGPSVDGNMVRLSDRWLRYCVNRIEWAPLDGSANWATECASVFGASGPSSGTLSEAGEGLYWVLTTGNRMALYDAVHHTVGENRGWLGAYTNPVAWYAKELNVFVVYDEPPGAEHPGRLTVLANEVAPAALSAPALVPVPARGVVSQVTVSLTGAQGEPVPDTPIDWALTGMGALSAAQSRTDADGVASCEYRCPPAASGNVTLTASAIVGPPS